ncbi:MAG: heavy-metal-associated domain-containing protein [Gemmatimonadota bacterium]
MKNPGSKALTAGLTLLLGLALAPGGASAQAETAAPRQISVTILGMSCPFCAYGVERKLKSLDGVEDLEVVLKSGIATLTMDQGADVSNEELTKKVKNAGFKVEKITRNFDSAYADYGPDEGK